jgi:hypothetical protein
MAGEEPVARVAHLENLNRENSRCDGHGHRSRLLCDLSVEARGARSHTPPLSSPCSNHSEKPRGLAPCELA